MKQLNRIKIVLVEQNKTAKWLSDQIGKNMNNFGNKFTHRVLLKIFAR